MVPLSTYLSPDCEPCDCTVASGRHPYRVGDASADTDDAEAYAGANNPHRVGLQRPLQLLDMQHFEGSADCDAAEWDNRPGVAVASCAGRWGTAAVVASVALAGDCSLASAAAYNLQHGTQQTRYIKMLANNQITLLNDQYTL